MNGVVVGCECDRNLWRISGTQISDYVVNVRFVSKHEAIIYIVAKNKSAISVSTVKK